MLLARQLHAGGQKAEARAIRRVVRHMWRRPAVRTTSVKSQPVTPAIRASMRRYAISHPDASQHEIGSAHGVNAGRVSEALAGKRR